MIRVDNSTLRAVARCTMEAVWRYGLGYTTVEEGEPLRVGSAVHAAHDAYFKNEGDTKLALGVLAHEYNDMDAVTEDRLQLDNVKLILAQWYSEHPLERLPWVGTEATFETDFKVPLTDDIEFCGRLDGIVRSRVDGRWYVLEHKTTGRITSYWTKQFQFSSQVTGYIWAGRQLKDAPVVGAFINAIELSKLPSDPVRTCREHKVKYAECGPNHMKAEVVVTQRNSAQIDDWRGHVIRLTKRFQRAMQTFGTVEAALDAPQEGMFHGACTYCTFSQFCQTGRRPELVESLLVRRPWEVIAGE